MREKLNEKTVYSRPEKFEAVRIGLVPDLELAKLCGGRYEPSDDGKFWVLEINHRRGRPGDWVMMNEENTFFIAKDKEFKETYVEKVSYEDQSD